MIETWMVYLGSGIVCFVVSFYVAIKIGNAEVEADEVNFFAHDFSELQCEPYLLVKRKERNKH